MSYSNAFFEVSAQLIPVLLLAMVVEERLQPEGSESPSGRVGRSWLLASLMGAEIIALAVVAGGLPATRSVGNIVALLMLLSGFLITLPAIGVELGKGRSPRERLGHGLAGLSLIVLVFVVTLSVQF